MDAKDITDLVHFSDQEPATHELFETERLWAQTVCLDRTGSYGPVSDRDADALLTVLAGEAVFLVEKKRKRLKLWGAVIVPAAAELVMTNASTEPLVVLMVIAPPPPPSASG